MQWHSVFFNSQRVQTMVPTNIVLAGATGVAVGLPGLEEEVDNAGRTCTAVLSIFALDVWQPIKGNYDLLNAVTIETISSFFYV
jgi:hypothetical protein